MQTLTPASAAAASDGCGIARQRSAQWKFCRRMTTCNASDCPASLEFHVSSLHNSVKSFIRLTRKTILITLKQPKQHTVYRRFGFTPEAFIRTDFRCRSSVCKSLSHTWRGSTGRVINIVFRVNLMTFFTDSLQVRLVINQQ